MTASALNAAQLKANLAGPAIGVNLPLQSTVSPLGELRVSNPASQLFLDTFNTATIDTINKWASSNGGTGSAPAGSVGSVLLSGGTTANSFSKLVSINSFAPSEPGYLLFQARCNLQFPVSTTGLVNLGLGTSPGSPTIASPITQFIGFELTTAGKLQAVVYQTGTRVLVQDLSVAPPNTPPGTAAPQPQDANAHKYFIYFRGDNAYWCIDDKDNVVASINTGALGPDIDQLPLLFQVVSNGTPATTLQVNAASLGDTSHTGATPMLFNGFTNEQQKSNTDTNTALINAAAATTSQTGTDQINTNGRGLIAVLNMTNVGTGSVTITIQGKDVVSGQYYTLLAGAAVTTNSTNVYTVYPGAPATANVSANSPLPRTWRVITTANNANATTYTVGASVIV